MKNRLGVLAIGLMLGGTCFAGTTRGYLAENHGIEFYAGIDVNGYDTQFDTSHFSKAQLNAAWKCMDKRETHAILVTTKEVKITVPTHIPGRTTTVTQTQVTKVGCVKAPGFLTYWREYFRRG